jgi:hypothetical protein
LCSDPWPSTPTGSVVSSSGYGASGQIWSFGAGVRGDARVFVVVRLLEQAVVSPTSLDEMW